MLKVVKLESENREKHRNKTSSHEPAWSIVFDISPILDLLLGDRHQFAARARSAPDGASSQVTVNQHTEVGQDLARGYVVCWVYCCFVHWLACNVYLAQR